MPGMERRLPGLPFAFQRFADEITTAALAWLEAHLASEPDERRLRLLYNASNQLSLHLERLLRAEEAEADRHRAIVEAMPQGVLLTDGAMRILQSNQAATRRLLISGTRCTSP